MRARALVPVLASILLLGLGAVPGGAADDPTFSISGQVVDTAGRSVEYATIMQGDSGYAVSGPDGRFRIANTWSGTYRLGASAQDPRFVAGSAPRSTVTVVDRDVDDVRLTVRRNGNIVVRAVTDTGAVQSAIHVIAKRGTKSYGRHWANTAYAIDDLTAREIRVRESHSALTNLPDGTYDIEPVGGSVDWRTHTVRLSQTKVSVADGSSPLITATVAPKPRAVFTGRIVTSTGKPLSGAVVRPYTWLGAEPDDHPNWCWPARARTDRAGRYSFSCVQNATARAIITDRAWKHVSRDVRARGRLGTTTSLGTTRLQRGAMVSVKIVGSSGAKIPGGVFVEPFLKRGGKFKKIHKVVPELAYSGTATTAKVRGLPAGTYRFCYRQGDGPGTRTRYRDLCPTKTHRIKAGSSEKLPTARLKR